MTLSAPNFLNKSALSSPPQVAITWFPANFANCTTNCPVPPAAAVTNTFSLLDICPAISNPTERLEKFYNTIWAQPNIGLCYDDFLHNVYDDLLENLSEGFVKLNIEILTAAKSHTIAGVFFILQNSHQEVERSRFEPWVQFQIVLTYNAMKICRILTISQTHHSMHHKLSQELFIDWTGIAKLNYYKATCFLFCMSRNFIICTSGFFFFNLTSSSWLNSQKSIIKVNRREIILYWGKNAGIELSTFY